MRSTIAGILLFCSLAVTAQRPKYSELFSKTAINLWPDPFAVSSDTGAIGDYDKGTLLKAVESVWNSTGDGMWFNYLQRSIDVLVGDDGSIKNYRPDEYDFDHLNIGRTILTLYRVTGNPKYKKAADNLRHQLLTQPRTKEGGFWHKKSDPAQVWLDDLCMEQPFFAEYAMLFHEDSSFNDVARQFILIERNARDADTGLSYYRWDETRSQNSADRETGRFPSEWGRGIACYGMAIVDVLEYFPAKHPGRDSLLSILNRYVKAIVKKQDKRNALWFNVIDKTTEPKSYVDVSSSCMIIYTLARAARLGYIPGAYATNAKRAYEGILKEYVRVENSHANLPGTPGVPPLSGNSYREGTFEHYTSKPVASNDAKGMGAFIQCAVEMEISRSSSPSKTVMLDRFYNSEKRKDAVGSEVFWHYTWEERSHPGFYLFGEIFRRLGGKLAALDQAPTTQDLQKADIYIIVDPDHHKDNSNPHFMTQNDAQVISQWVKGGGVLLLLANDSANCDLQHFNVLASKFGISFTNRSRNMVKNDEFAVGAVEFDSTVFNGGAFRAYLKDISVIEVRKPAFALVGKEADVIVAEARYGKGTVLAVGDPWVYNEYIDGRKLLPGFNNYKAATDLANYLYAKANRSRK